MESNNDVKYAGFWVRVLASWIDGLLLLLPLAMVEVLLGNDSTMRLFLFFVLWWLYTSCMLSSSWRATIGKKIVAIEVVDIYGKQLTFNGASLRFVYSIISYMLIIPILIMLFDEKKQTFHDKMAKTIVLDTAVIAADDMYRYIPIIRVIGYVLLAIFVAIKIYALSMMIFLWSGIQSFFSSLTASFAG